MALFVEDRVGRGLAGATADVAEKGAARGADGRGEDRLEPAAPTVLALLDRLGSLTQLGDEGGVADKRFSSGLGLSSCSFSSCTHGSGIRVCSSGVPFR